jgi:hypothetical protein
MPIPDPAQYKNKYKASERPEFYQPYPSDSNDKPFMTYEAISGGAMGKAAPKQGK